MVKKLSITLAKKMSETLGAGKGVIIICFDNAGLRGGVSYGNTVKDCHELGVTLDTICDILEVENLI